MRIILIKSLDLIGRIFSFVYSESITSAVVSLRNRIYTGFIRRNFAKMGNSVFMYPSYVLVGLRFVSIGDGCIFERDIQLTAWNENENEPQIIFGNNCLIRRGSHITALNSIIIGDNLLTGTNVLITDNSHGKTDFESLRIPIRGKRIVSKGGVIIGNNVWLGNNVCVMPGVTIGNCVIIGANSVVTHDIPDYSVAVGIPAKVIKQYSSEIISNKDEK